MHPSFNLTQGTVAHRISGAGTSLVLLAAGCWGVANLARALPDIMGQFTRPCSGCYFGAFEPPLEPYRNPARQSGSDGATPPAPNARRAFAIDSQVSQSGGAGHWLALSDLTATQQTSLFGDNRIGPGANLSPAQHDGGMMREIYASAGARRLTRSGADLIGRGALNDTLVAPALPSMLQAAPLVNGQLAPASTSLGAPRDGSPQTQDRGWDNVVRHATGVAVASRNLPYWRVAVQKDLQQHFLQLGTYGMHAGLVPPRRRSAGKTAALTDLGIDANYQFTADPGSVVGNLVSANSRFIHEPRSIDGNKTAIGNFTLDAFHTDLSWGIAESVIPSIEYFRTAGSVQALQYLWPGARQNSAGVIAAVTYVPWNTAGSPIPVLNLRFAAQYVSYTDFKGSGRGAGGNNGVYLSLWSALHF